VLKAHRSKSKTAGKLEGYKAGKLGGKEAGRLEINGTQIHTDIYRLF
jgi:hypothetical protein